MDRETISRSKRLTRRTTLKGAFGLALAAIASGTVGAHERGDNRTEFTANLSPENAVPPKYEPASCGAEGVATFDIDDSEERIAYEIRLSDIQGVSGIHLHQGSPGENGPHVAEIYNGEPTGDVGDFFSLSAEGEITSEDLSHEFDGSFADMVELVRSGETYLQVHRGPEGTEVVRGPLE